MKKGLFNLIFIITLSFRKFSANKVNSISARVKESNIAGIVWQYYYKWSCNISFNSFNFASIIN